MKLFLIALVLMGTIPSAPRPPDFTLAAAPGGISSVGLKVAEWRVTGDIVA